MRFIIAVLLCLVALPGGAAVAQQSASKADEDAYLLQLIPRLATVNLEDREAIAALAGVEKLIPYGTQRSYLSQWWSGKGVRFAFYLVYSTHGPASRQSSAIEVRIGATAIGLAQVRAMYPGMAARPEPFVSDREGSQLFELPAAAGNRVLLVFNARHNLTHIFVKARPTVAIPNLFAGLDPRQVVEMKSVWPVPIGRPEPDGRSGQPCLLGAADTATLVKLFGRQVPTGREVISLTGSILLTARLRDGGELLVLVPIAAVMGGKPRMLVLPGGLYVELKPADAATIDRIAGNCP